MSDQKFVRVDKIKWWLPENNTPQPICPQHDMRIYPIETSYVDSAGYRRKSTERSEKLLCDEGPHVIKMPREFQDQKRYVRNKIESKIFASHTFVTIDDDVIPVAREKLKDSPYWVDAKVTKSKSGTRLIVWAGNREKKDKTQLFIEPELKKLSFDHNDTHPNEVFAIVEAKFLDGSSTIIEKKTII
jgi:hypothetical protein